MGVIADMITSCGADLRRMAESTSRTAAPDWRRFETAVIEVMTICYEAGKTEQQLIESKRSPVTKKEEPDATT